MCNYIFAAKAVVRIKKHGSVDCRSVMKKMLEKIQSNDHHQKKVHVGNDQEKVQSERNSRSKIDAGKNQIDNQELILREHIVSLVSSYFPIGGHSVPALN